MFTVEQIKQAHSKVKSGADFPAFIQEIKALGVIYYETFVKDGHTDYSGANGYKTTAPLRYADLLIADTCRSEIFKAELKAHQQGQTSYLVFIESSANNGIEKWAVDLGKMTCTYFDKAGKEVLVENIPG